MPFPPSILVPKKRVGRKPRKASSAPAPVGNQIIAVSHGEEGDRIVVSLNSPVSGISDSFEAMQVSADGGGTWSAAISFNNEDPLNIQFFMSDDVSAATQWRVGTASVWTFENAEALAEPFEGEIG